MLTVFIGVFAKASTPMDITELGITNESKFDSKKAFGPILVTLSGIVTLVRLLQPEKA